MVIFADKRFILTFYGLSCSLGKLMNRSTLDIERDVANALAASDDTPLIDRILLAYGQPAGSVTRLRKGAINKAKTPGDLLWKGKLFYRETLPGMLRSESEDCRNDSAIGKEKPRFIIISDGSNWAATDTKTGESIEFLIASLARHYDFFLPWADYEKAETVLEKAADIRAARKMGDLYDALRKANKNLSDHDMNVFMARLLFCFFAEDSGIFPQEGQFTRYVREQTADNGSDLREHIERIFLIMNTPEDGDARKEISLTLAAFPYVNGGLFRRSCELPTFTPKARKAVLDAGDLDWSDINTDIFGNMFQACVNSKTRATLGEHYTSVPNIMKVLRPLFLDNLAVEAEKVKGNERKVKEFIDRLSRIRFFDPACGSGNFLLIAFKEMRRLEMDVLESVPRMLPMPSISISQFYGIEIDDFAHEIAMLSLWLVEHQMNQEFEERFGARVPTLPLKPQEHIVHGNALRMEWNKVCPRGTAAPLYTLVPLLANAAPTQSGDEVYVFGNPPYLGSSLQGELQKGDMDIVFAGWENYRSLDYVSCWFVLAAQYIKDSKISAAFVATNSITQGEQVTRLWEPLLNKLVEISFAYSSFKWTNNAKYQAGITCVIIGLNAVGRKTEKKLIIGGHTKRVSSISPYIMEGEFIPIRSSSRPCSTQLPPMTIGSKPADEGHLILNRQEKENLCREFPLAKDFVKSFIGSQEYIRGEERFIIYMTDEQKRQAEQCPFIASRLNAVSNMRSKSRKKPTQKLAFTPHKLVEDRYKPTDAIIIPRHTSENRLYVPMGYVDRQTIIADSAFAIYDAEPWIFAILNSRMHMAWMRITCGRLKTDYRYSAAYCYNTFPLRELTEAEKEHLSEAAYKIIEAREASPGKTPRELYENSSMPDDLRQAHDELDHLVDSLYRKKAFMNDEERLSCLFELYKEMTTAHE